jgi:hypothetical protein
MSFSVNRGVDETAAEDAIGLRSFFASSASLRVSVRVGLLSMNQQELMGSLAQKACHAVK